MLTKIRQIIRKCNIHTKRAADRQLFYPALPQFRQCERSRTLVERFVNPIGEQLEMENIARINLVTRFRILLVKELDLPPFLDRLDQAGEFLHIEGARMQVVKRIGTYTAHCNRNDLSGIIAQNIEKDTSHVARLCSSIFLDLFRSIEPSELSVPIHLAGYPVIQKFRLIPEGQCPAGVGLIFKKIPDSQNFSQAAFISGLVSL